MLAEIQIGPFYAGKLSLKSIYEQGGSLTKFTLDDT
jgi:hypothetical protein